MSGASQQQRSEQAYRSPADNRDIRQVNPPFWRLQASTAEIPPGSWTLTRQSSRDYV
jgi:hypothetical protein